MGMLLSGIVACVVHVVQQPDAVHVVVTGSGCTLALRRVPARVLPTGADSSCLCVFPCPGVTSASQPHGCL